MSDVIAPLNTVTFTITRVPRAQARVKTLARLMRMQPEIRSGLKKLQGRRARIDNRTYQRAGKMWTDRAKATRLTRVEPGASFTLKLTPQIINDVRSIESYVEASAAG